MIQKLKIHGDNLYKNVIKQKNNSFFFKSKIFRIFVHWIPLRNHEIYRRHLVTHVNNSEISTREMKEILFQTKYSRNEKSVKAFNIAKGQTCCLCGNIVQALSKHVTRVHKIS